VGGFSTKFPLVDNESFWEKMGVPNTAHGSILGTTEKNQRSR
jgi:hypothetical protein